MPSSSSSRFLQPLLTRAALTALVACVASSTVSADVVTLAPLHAGSFATGSGADARFVRIDNDWRGSTVLWNEEQGVYGSGDAIGSFGWGTGLWGRADFDSIQAAAKGQGGGAAPTIEQQQRGVVSTINYGNARYNECHATTWGAAELLPFFSSAAPLGSCGDPELGDPAQHNWTAFFSGFIRITDPGLYNFSVLFDDGYFFKLIGADGLALEIEQDFLNPREREGFDHDLSLAEGLYGFELGAWNRLGAGVVDLRWSRGGDGPEWTLVPTESLLPGSAVNEPAVPLLLTSAALALWLAGRRRRTAAAAA